MSFTKALTEAIETRKYCNGRSEFGQDDWVIKQTKEKRNGYFVDIGAAHPRFINNTYKLETKYNWDGICVEPNSFFHSLLVQERKVKCVHAAVSNITGFLEFTEQAGWGSTLNKNIEQFAAIKDMHYIPTKVVEVPVFTLLNLLDSCLCPNEIDYMNVDAPGAEADIICGSEWWMKYLIKLITVKNNPPTSGKVISHLTSIGYKQEGNIGIDLAFIKL